MPKNMPHLTSKWKENISKSQKGEKAYWYGKKQSIGSNLKRSLRLKGIKPIKALKRLREILPKGYWYGKTFSEEHKKKLSIQRTGEKHPNWRGGKSFEPYGREFNRSLKNQIRQRDKICWCCGMPPNKEKFIVHHIDGIKIYNFPQNLISLHRNCHGFIEGQIWKGGDLK